MKTKSTPKAVELRRVQIALRRIAALAASNKKLKGEIVRRLKVESDLKQSERRQKLSLAESEKLQSQLRDLSRGILDAQEEEHRRISRELHDEVLQGLVGINVHLELLGREAELNLAQLRPKIILAQRIVAESVSAIHRFARDLRPMILDDLGLLPALGSCLADFRKRTAIRVRFTAFEEVEELNNARRTVLFRLVQAALSNVAQHSGASQVQVSLKAGGGTVILEIHDNGKSFDVASILNAKRYKRLGLLGMRERVEMVGGTFLIRSAPGKGTTIRAEIPNKNRAVKKIGP